MTEPFNRSNLRGTMRAARRALSPQARMAAAEALARRLLALPVATGNGFVAGYWAMDGEIALHAWQVRLPASLTYCLPVVCDNVLRFGAWKAGDALVTNRFGIPEPDLSVHQLIDAERMAMVVAPLVAFDALGHRIGMGGGWYDRSFAFRRSLPAPPCLVGAAFAQQQVDCIPVEPWDVSLDAICTDSATFDLRTF